MIQTLRRLRDLGNTLIVVEHDEDTMRAADWIVDMGPGAGEHGGYVVAEGPLDAIIANPDSLTGRFLSGELRGAAARRSGASGNGKLVRIVGARENNLKNIDGRDPAGRVRRRSPVSRARARAR